MLNSIFGYRVALVCFAEPHSARRDSTNTALLMAMRDLASNDIEFSLFHRLDLLPVFSPDPADIARVAPFPKASQ